MNKYSEFDVLDGFNVCNGKIAGILLGLLGITVKKHLIVLPFKGIVLEDVTEE